MLFVPDRGQADRLVLRLANHVPRRADGYEITDVAAAMSALIEAVRRAGTHDAPTRLVVLRSELEAAHSRAFAPGGAPALDWPVRVSAAASVLSALATAAGIAFGGPPG